MANTIQYAEVLQKNLDKIMVQGSVTGWMEDNAEQVIYQGGKEIKIPKMSMDGLADYDRNSKNGYTPGAFTLEYETRTMTYDRGREFLFDANDVNESNFIIKAGKLMSDFQKTKVTPEVDAVRLSTLAGVAIEHDNVEYGFTPSKTSRAIDKVKDTITKIRENGFEGQLIIHCTYAFKNQIEKEMMGTVSPIKLMVGGVETEVLAIDGCPLIPVVSNRMVTKLSMLDGRSEETSKGGFKKADDALDVNFMVIAKEVPIAVSKTDKLRIFDPETYQGANAWKTDYRKYHDIWVMDNKVDGIFVNIKDAKPATPQA